MTSDNPLLFLYTKQAEKKRRCRIPHVFSVYMEPMGVTLQSRNGSGCKGSELFG